MFRWFRDLFRAYVGAWLAFEILVLVVVLPVLAVWTFVSLLHAGQLGEAATALILVSIAGAFASFILWVRYDVKETTRRRDQRRKKKAEATEDITMPPNSAEREIATIQEPPSEQIRQIPGP